MSKKISMPTRPKVDPTADKWVNERTILDDDGPRIKPKRLTIEIDPDLHRELKIHCASSDINIADLVRDLIADKLRPGRLDPIVSEMVSTGNDSK